MAVLRGAATRCRWRIVNSVRGFCLNPSSETDLKLSTVEEPPKGRNVQWVFLGCPGVGKGTYAARLSSLLGVPHIATGDLVRHELSARGPLSSQVNRLIFR